MVKIWQPSALNSFLVPSILSQWKFSKLMLLLWFLLYFLVSFLRKINPCEHQTDTNTLAHFTLHLLSFDSHTFHSTCFYTPTLIRAHLIEMGEEFWGKIKIKARTSAWITLIPVPASFRLFGWCWDLISISNFYSPASGRREGTIHVIWIFLTFSQP